MPSNVYPHVSVRPGSYFPVQPVFASMTSSAVTEGVASLVVHRQSKVTSICVPSIIGSTRVSFGVEVSAASSIEKRWLATLVECFVQMFVRMSFKQRFETFWDFYHVG